MEIPQKRSFSTSLRFTGSKTLEISGSTCVEKYYSLHIKREGEKRNYCWEIILEFYEDYKVIMISFYLKQFNKSNGIKKYKRNQKKEGCFDPLLVLRLLTECFNLCLIHNGYAFGFYAIDDYYTERREDINPRMSVYTKFLQRKCLDFKFKNIGNIHDSIYLGYDPDILNEDTLNNFISFYKPILYEQIRKLYNIDNSQKL